MHNYKLKWINLLFCPSSSLISLLKESGDKLNVGTIKIILSTMTEMSDRIEKLEEEFVKQEAEISSLKSQKQELLKNTREYSPPSTTGSTRSPGVSWVGTPTPVPPTTSSAPSIFTRTMSTLRSRGEHWLCISRSCQSVTKNGCSCLLLPDLLIVSPPKSKYVNQ